MDDEQREACERCEWQEWEVMVWVMTVFASLILGMFIVSGISNHRTNDTNTSTTNSHIHGR